MGKFVWVEKESIDPKGEWLRVKYSYNESLLCERIDPYEPDVFIEVSEVVRETDEEIF